MKGSRFVAVSALSVLLAAPAGAQTTIDSWTGWNAGSTASSAPLQGSAMMPQPVEVFAGALALTPGVRYASPAIPLDPWHDPGNFDRSMEVRFDLAQQQVVPEPISLILLGTGLVGVAAARRRRRTS